MKRLITASALVLLGVSISFAADDPIAARKALMKENGKATKSIVPMLRGAAAFDLATVQAALKTYAAAAEQAPALFGPGTDKGKTDALPAVWSNAEDFKTRFAKFGADVKAASAAITDEASFKANIPGILKGDCGGCHETYRAKEQ